MRWPTTYHAERIEAAVKTAISALLEQLEALPAETILEYKYQIVLQERRETYQAAQQHLSERERDRETLRGEVARAIRGEMFLRGTSFAGTFTRNRSRN